MGLGPSDITSQSWFIRWVGSWGFLHILKLVWLALPCCSYKLDLAGKVYPLSLGNPALSWTFSLQPSDSLSSLLLKVNIILPLLYSHYPPPLPASKSGSSNVPHCLHHRHASTSCYSFVLVLTIYPGYTPQIAMILFQILSLCYLKRLPVICHYWQLLFPKYLHFVHTVPGISREGPRKNHYLVQ